jgi:hypothetical protein
MTLDCDDASHGHHKLSRVKIPPPRVRVIQRRRNVSENDLEIPGEQSHTVHVAGNTSSTGAASGGTGAPAKKAKIMLTEKQQAFVKMFQPAASKIDKPRKIEVRHILGRGAFLLASGIFQGKNRLLQSIIDNS